MKISLRNKKIQGVLSLIFSSILLMSYKDNPPDGKTGAPGESLCTECHNSGNPGGFDGGVEITGFPATIMPGTTYPLTITVSNPNGLANRAGFQFTILNAANQKFGTFSGPSANCAISVGSRDYVEHSPAVDFPGSNTVVWTVNWKAPDAGSSQTIKLYTAANIANGNNNNDGDWIVTNQYSGQFTPAPDPLTVTMSGNSVLCFGESTGSATATPAGGTPPYGYTWSNGGSTATISNLPAGTYTVTVTDNASQSTTGSYTVSQPSTAVSVEIQAPVTTIDCNNTSASLTASGSGGSPSYSYLWSNGSTTASINVFQGGSYSVTATDAAGCEASTSITITQIDPPVVDLEEVGPLCQDTGPVTLNASPLGGFFDGPGVTGNIFDPAVAGPGTYGVTYTYSENGCTVTDIIDIVVNATPVVTINAPVQVCLSGGPVTLSATPAGGFWSGPGVIGNQFFPDVAGAGTHDITYTVDVNGCTGSTTAAIEVVSPTPVDVVPLDDMCTSDQPVALEGVPAGGSWSGIGVTNNTFDPTAAGAGTFTLTYSYTNPSGCISTTTITVNVTACGCENPATANAGIDQSVCTFGPVLLIGSTNTSPTWTTGGDGSFTDVNNAVTEYQWGTNDRTAGTVTLTLIAADPDGDGPCTSFSDQITITYNGIDVEISSVPVLCLTDTAVTLSASVPGGLWAGDGVSGNTFDPALAGTGIHTVYYTVENDFGCNGFDTIGIEVRNCNCHLEAHLEAETTACTGDSIGTLTVVIDVEGTQPYAYSWSNGETTASIDNLAAGTYTVTLTDLAGCEVVLSATVTNQPVSFRIEQIRANCADVLCIQNISGGDGPFTIHWSTGATTQCIDMGQFDSGTYEASVTNNNGCTATLQFDYVKIPELTVTLDSITTATTTDDGVIQITASGGVEPYSYRWYSGGVLITDAEDPVNLSAGTYMLIVTDAGGCTDTSEYTIHSEVSTHDLEQLIGQVKVYPSLADRFVNLDFVKMHRSDLKLTVFDINGQRHIRETIPAASGTRWTINTSMLLPGMYLIVLEDKERSVCKRFMIGDK